MTNKEATLKVRLEEMLKCPSCSGVGSKLATNLGVYECQDCGGDRHCLYGSEFNGYFLEEVTSKILKLISKEIKKNRPKESYFASSGNPNNPEPYKGISMEFAQGKTEGYGQALSEYDKVIADTLK